jgi:O-antigen ligase
MTALVPIAMLGWIPAGLWLFRRYEGRRAIIVGFLIAWLFLPVYKYSLPGLPDYSKISALSYVMLIGVALFDRKRFQAFRLRAFDAPILLFGFSGFFSSLANGLGAYDGLSASLGILTVWFVPYFLGRLYFDDLEALRDLTAGLFIGGLLYIPFCMFEMVMSPNLHRMLYGFHPHEDFSQARRWGGWRPMVFMQHGLMVGMWMTMASLAGLHLNRTGQIAWIKRTLKAPPTAVVGFLIAITILCKSMGALFLLLAGWAALRFGMRMKSRLPIAALALIPIVYIALRTTGSVSGDSIGAFLSDQLRLPDERVGSLTFRLYNEDMLMDKAFARPLFGWGGWQRSFVFNSSGRPISVPDGLWIIVLGRNGWVGLVSMLTALLLPVWLFLKRYPPGCWADRPLAAAGLAPVALLCLFAIDSLLNDMYNPLIMLFAGGLTGLVLSESPGAPPPEEEAAADVSAGEPKTPRLL